MLYCVVSNLSYLLENVKFPFVKHILYSYIAFFKTCGKSLHLEAFFKISCVN